MTNLLARIFGKKNPMTDITIIGNAARPPTSAAAAAAHMQSRFKRLIHSSA